MATARELLQQADALMRRNRAGGGQGAPIASEAPALFEVPRPAAPMPANEAEGEPSVSPDLAAPAKATRDDDADAPGKVAAVPLDDFDDFPVLTDAVTDREPISVLGVPEESGEPSIWPEGAVPKSRHDDWLMPPPAPEAPDEPPADESAAGAALPEATDAEAVVAEEAAGDAALVPLGDEELQIAVERGEAEIETLLRAEESAAISAAASLGADALPTSFSASVGDALHDAATTSGAVAARDPVDQARWDSLAEEVRMQVLQRLDIFTDTGLQEQLAARLQPIVDRASDDLVAAINQHLGALLRSYVSEAIEREIEKLRRSND
jgi:hypothetical protein